MHLQDRKRGYMDALSALQLLDESLICEIDYNTRQEEIIEFFKNTFIPENKIDGLLTITGGISTMAIRSIAAMGIKLQTDVHVVAFGRVDVAVGIPIPYVKQPLDEICKHSFDILMNKIKSPDNKVIDCIVPASIVTDPIF